MKPGQQEETTNVSEVVAKASPVVDFAMESQEVGGEEKDTSVPTKQTPLPRVVMLLVCLGMFANSFLIVMLFPFVPFMVRDFGVEEKKLGYYVGFIATSLFVGRAAGSLPWGLLVDRYGRRIPMIVTLGCITVFGLAFGFSKNFYWAVVFRFLTGFSNGAVIIVKAMIADVCDDTNQGLALSYMALANGVGLVFGPAMGGLLAKPAEKFPWLFGKDSIFAVFPYLLPCLVGACVAFVTLFIALFYLPETLMWHEREQERKSSSKIQKYSKLASEPGEGSGEEEDSLISSANEEESSSVCVGASKSSPSAPGTIRATLDVSPSGEAIPLRPLSQRHRDNMYRSREMFEDELSVSYRGSMGNLTLDIESTGDNRASLPRKVKFPHSKQAFSRKCSAMCSNEVCGLLKDIWVILPLVVYGLFALGLISIDEVYPLWAVTKRDVGGLDFTLNEIGMSLPLVGFALIVVQWFIFPKIERRCSARKLSFIANITLIVFITILPNVSHLADKPYALWPVLETVLLSIRFNANCVFISVSMFINNSVSRKDLGKINGIAMLVAASMRGLGPTLCGSIFAWTAHSGYGYPLNYHFVFYFINCVLLACMAIVLTFPKRLETMGANGDYHEIPIQDESEEEISLENVTNGHHTDEEGRNGESQDRIPFPEESPLH
eukprot:Nk52_evm50s2152 gene=Nk52_evmTU50s2152